MARFAIPRIFSSALLVAVLLLAGPFRAQAQTGPGSQGLVADSTELRVLREFYAATGGAQWTDNTGWLVGTSLADAATWFGVRVVQGDVVSLTLAANNVHGPLPAALGQLRALQVVQLWRNPLADSIPAAWGSLSRLTSLNMAETGLRGQLPATLGQLIQLQVLDLHSNQLRGPIPPELGQLTALTELNLSGNALTGPLPATLGQLGQLRQLDLSTNRLSGPLPPALGNLARLERLGLWRNLLSDSIPAAWGGLSRLTGLNLAETDLRGQLPATLGQLVAVQVLDLHGNQFRGPIPPELGQLAALTELNLAGNTLTGLIPATLGQLTQLRQLDLSSNQLRGLLPPELSQLNRLERLSLWRNGLSGPLPIAWGRLNRLRELNLGANRLSGPLPDSLARLTSLRTLLLAENRFSGPLTPLVGLVGLDRLEARDNAFVGLLPAALLHGPRVVQLQNNQLADVEAFSGSIPVLQLSLAGNTLDFAALERLCQGPNQPRPASLDATRQRPPARLDTVTYRAGGPLTLTVRNRGEQYGYGYQWQRLVGGQWLDLPGDTLAIKRWAVATAAEQGTYRRLGHNRWFTDPALAPLVLASGQVYADLLPYPPLPRNRPDDANTGLALAAPLAVAPAARPADVNYQRVWTPRVALTTLGPASASPADTLHTAQAQVVTQYFDGLGRPLQTVQHRASPQGRDLVQPMAYDALGRSPRQYLPYADTAEAARTTVQGYHYRALAHQAAFYARTGPPGGGAGPLAPGDPVQGVARTGRAFAETLFEASPLSRVRAQGAAGEAWQLTGGHLIERIERPNLATDSVLRFAPGDGAGADPGYAGFYAPGELWGTVVADVHGPNEPGAQGYVTMEWTDKEGHLVLRQVEANRARVALTPVSPGTAGREQTVLRSRWLRTAYAYDAFGRLRATLQPEGTRRLLPLAVPAGSTAPLPAAVAPFVFHTRYDARGRVIAKQVPGTDGETEFIYDQLDRPILSRDAGQRGRREWSVSKYDALGRVVLTGLVSTADTLGRAALQALAAADTAAAQQYEERVGAGSANVGGYSYDHAFPRFGQNGFVGGQVLSLTYYDDYDFDNDGQADAHYDPSTDGQFAAGAAPVADALRATGLVTRTKIRVLGVADNDPSQAACLSTTTFYDERGRPVQVQSTNARKNPVTGEAYGELVTSQLDFTGQVVQRVAVHAGPSHSPVPVAEFFRYDPAGRLLTTRQQLPGEARPSRLDSVAYNEIGQAVRKTLGTGRLRQDVDYAYNIRGWLTQLNNPRYPVAGDLFSLSLHYETGFTRGYEQHNGNLTGQTWRGRDGVQRAYGYAYDAVNRLLQGDYVARTPGTAVGANDWRGEADRYRLSFASYDDNGNLLTLRRRGLLAGATRFAARQYGPVDALTYAYVGNRLQAVEDAVSTNELPRAAGYHGAPTSLAGDFQEQGVHQGQEYFYDANGNLTQDRNKGITGLAYNHLNLPRQIHFGPGADSVVFRYAASGQKVAKLVYQTGKPMLRTDYLGPYQYEGDSLRFFPHAEGRVLRSVNSVGLVSYAREFSIKDHLGNLRLAYRLGQVRRDSASLEPDAASHGRESQQFDSLSVSYPIAQSVGSRARTGSYAAKLNAGGGAPQPLGPLKQLAVQRGDTVTVTAYGLYPQAVQNNFWFSLASFLTGLLHPANAPVTGPDPTRGRAGLPLLQVGVAAGLMMLPQLSPGVAKGYVRVLVFNADSVLVGQQVQALSSAALGNYERLRLRVVVPQDGYVTAYVGNESEVDVYFDDVTIEHRQGLQVQENSYDPTGLELAGLAGTTPGLKRLSQYKWNGKEFQTDLGLNWNHQDWRFFDPQLMRWHVVDPEIENGQESMSPYVFGFDNAVRFNDPDGMKPQDDFFNNNGRFLKHTNTKTNNIYVGGKSFSSLDVKNTDERQAAANVVGYYANKLGITGVGVAHNPKKPASENPAFTTSKGKIYVNTNGGINHRLNDSNNLSNVLVHEKQHQDDFKSGLVNLTLLRHAEIYLKQAQDPSFGKGTADWQNGQAVSFGRYIMTDLVNSVDGGTNAADALLKSFNATNTAGVQVKPNMANESIVISNGNKSYAPIKFEPVSD